MTAWRVVVLSACAGGTLACRGILDVTGYGLIRPEEDSGGPRTYLESCSGVDGYVSATCRDCIKDACCVEARECAGDPGCLALSRCLATCEASDVACRTRCNLSIRRTSAASRFMACVAGAEACESCAASHATFGGRACTACLETEDREDMQAFSRNVASLELESCQMDCPPAFHGECACTDYAADGGPVLAKLRAFSRCDDSCREEDWSCLGSVEAPPLGEAAPDLDLHVRVALFEAQTTPLGGASVAACNPVDLDCANPIGLPATLDAATGFADLHLPSPQLGPYFGHLRIEWDDPRETRQNSALLYFFPPLRRSPSWTWRRLVSTTIAEVNARALDQTLDWVNKGGIVFSAATCNLLPASNLEMTLDTGEKIYYLTDILTVDADLTKTSSSGLGAVLHAAPGPKELQVVFEKQRVGTYKFSVAAGAITVLALSPVPLGAAP